MTNKSTPDAKAIRLDDLPLLFAFMERLQINTILDQQLPRHVNWAGDLSIGQVVVGWLISALSQSDHRLNRVVERRLVIRSILSARVEAGNLEARLARADADLRELTIRKQGKRRLSKDQIEQAVAKILERHRVEGLIKTCVGITNSQQEV
jgi:hypothetical protein